VRPEFEFIFRTLVDLRVDMDDLRREFEAYRRETALVPVDHRVGRLATREIPARSVAFHSHPAAAAEVAPSPGETILEEVASGGETTVVPDADPGVVVYRQGMTMDDVEREAIRATLESVGGNRRKAAEALGIGERTLYRKIGKYDLET
jgi:DNA-binding NtrC family response regulator